MGEEKVLPPLALPKESLPLWCVAPVLQALMVEPGCFRDPAHAHTMSLKTEH